MFAYENEIRPSLKCQKDDDVALTWEMHEYGLSYEFTCYEFASFMLFLLESLINQLIFFTTMSPF